MFQRKLTLQTFIISVHKCRFLFYFNNSDVYNFATKAPRSCSCSKDGYHMIATISAIAGKNVQPLLRSCRNHFLAIVTITASVWKSAYVETAQRSKSQRPLNFFGSDCSDHMETSLNSPSTCSVSFHFNWSFPFLLLQVLRGKTLAAFLESPKLFGSFSG